MKNMNSEGACSEQECSHGDQSDHSSAQPQDSAYVTARRAKQEQIRALVTNLTEVWQRSQVTSSHHHQIHQLQGSGQHKEWLHKSKKTFIYERVAVERKFISKKRQQFML